MSSSRKHLAWATALVALLALAVAAPAASAASLLQAAPLSADYTQYQARLARLQLQGIDRSFTFMPGVAPAPMDISGLAGEQIAPPMLTYAASYDLRTGGRVTAIRDQNPWGTCWTFGTMAPLESSLLPGELNDFSEDDLALNSGFDTGSTAAEKYDHGGNYWMSSAYLIRWDGPVNESDDAYGDSYTPSASTAKHVQEILYVPGGTAGTDTANIKYALTTYGAVGTSISWQASAYNSGTAGFYYGGSSSTNHAVTIVGWNDNYAAANFPTTPAGNGAWLVRNSWGTAWGQSGYFWISYYDRYGGRSSVRNVTFNGAESATNYTHNYYYDPLGEVNYVGYNAPTAWAANVFTATGTQSVGAIGFFTPAADTTYTVYAGASLGSLTARGSSTLALPGYHTVTFSSPLAVTGGSQFVVAVRLTAPGETYPVAIESAESGYSSQAAAAAGQSYVSSAGSSWTDLTTYDGDANVCVKAYATGSGPSPNPSPTPSSGDTTPPVTAADGYDSDWHRSPVTVTFSAVDPGSNPSGVDYTWYQVDGLPPAVGNSVTVPAPKGGTGDGAHTIAYHSVDLAGNPEGDHTVTVNIDTIGPVGVARNVSVRRGRVCKLWFGVSDAWSPEVTTVVRIKTLRGVTKKTFSWGYDPVLPDGYWWTAKFRCTLKPGKYRVVVTGKDLAGNNAVRSGTAKLVVRK